MKYTEKIQNLVNETLAAYVPLDTEEASLEQQLRENKITSTVFKEKKAVLEQQREAIRVAAYQQIEATRAAYAGAVARGTELDASMLHEDAQLLQLKSLDLTPRQFSALVEKHKDNPLMTSLLKGYADTREGLYADYLPGPEEKVNEFNGYADAANNALRSPASMQAALFADGRYTPAACTESD